MKKMSNFIFILTNTEGFEAPVLQEVLVSMMGTQTGGGSLPLKMDCLLKAMGSICGYMKAHCQQKVQPK